MLAISGNAIGGWNAYGIVDLPARKIGKGDLIPPAYIDDGERERKAFDVIVDFFLWSRSMWTPAGMTVTKAQGRNSFTPAAFAAVAKGI